MSLEEIEHYYNQGREQARLTRENGKLEQARTREILQRYMADPPATILDIGGGAGIYALWLAEMGYDVHLRDLMPLHVEQAREASQKQPVHPLASVATGDALKLEFPDGFADYVLLLGPLYHLTKRDDRVQALKEAYRVLKPSGYVFSATISQFASMMEGMMRGYLQDSLFAELVEQDVIDGQHRNPDKRPGYFTTAYFHHPLEIESELADAGLKVETVLAVEGPAAFMRDFDIFWEDEILRERILKLVRHVETEPTMLGTTGHLIAVGQKV